EAFSTVSSIQELSNLDVKAYPNPVDEILNLFIDALDGQTDVVLMDLQGRTVFRDQWSNIDNEINISHLPKGSYVLLIQNQYSQFRQVIIKN
ncbi:MAG: T9SS type A sorting domain-containing protein, partial [Bacteroidota bacterium]